VASAVGASTEVSVEEGAWSAGASLEAGSETDDPETSEASGALTVWSPVWASGCGSDPASIVLAVSDTGTASTTTAASGAVTSCVDWSVVVTDTGPATGSGAGATVAAASGSGTGDEDASDASIVLAVSGAVTASTTAASAAVTSCVD